MRNLKTQRGIIKEAALSWTLKKGGMPRDRDAGKEKAEEVRGDGHVPGTLGVPGGVLESKRKQRACGAAPGGRGTAGRHTLVFLQAGWALAPNAV